MDPAAEPSGAGNAPSSTDPPETPPEDQPPERTAQPSRSAPAGTSSSSAAAASSSASPSQPSRYESQKRRDWNTFLQYLRNHKPPLTLARCSGAHVIEFMKYLDQFGKTKVHVQGCAYFGHPNPPAPCTCPQRQAWGSLDALIGRLRAAHEESGGRPESNPFAARAVRIYLREVRESQSKARGIPYEKKKRKRQQLPPAPVSSSSSAAAAPPAPAAESSASASFPATGEGSRSPTGKAEKTGKLGSGP